MSTTIAEEDLRHDDEEYSPSVEPKSAKAWINLLTESEKAFDKWNDVCDRVEKEYANLEILGKSHSTRAREYQMFWANCEVIRPSICLLYTSDAADERSSVDL